MENLFLYRVILNVATQTSVVGGKFTTIRGMIYWIITHWYGTHSDLCTWVEVLAIHVDSLSLFRCWQPSSKQLLFEIDRRKKMMMRTNFYNNRTSRDRNVC